MIRAAPNIRDTAATGQRRIDAMISDTSPWAAHSDINNHEGDWEHIVVNIDRWGALTDVA